MARSAKNRLPAIFALWNSGDEHQAEYRAEFSPFLVQVALSEEKPPAVRFGAIQKLWDSGDDHQAEYRAQFYPTLLEFARTEDALGSQNKAIQLLWNTKDAEQAQRREDVLPILLEIIRENRVSSFMLGKLGRWDAIKLLDFFRNDT